MLEIGPGQKRITDFETLNVVWGPDVDYIVDASRPLPFPDNTFDVVFASHVLEHIPWHQIEAALGEWTRVLKEGGVLEVWVPDGYKLCKFIIDIEGGSQRNEWLDGWRPFNQDEDPMKWANGRLLYGVRTDYPSWHTSIITPKSLQTLFQNCGLRSVRLMDEAETRGVRHGWINLGVQGRKP